MIIVNIEQGSEAWLQERCGRFTATRIKTLMSGLDTSGFKGLISDVAAEIISGEVEETYSDANMERGKELEPEARMELERELGVDIQEVGFCLPDNEHLADWMGVSPDGLIPSDSAVVEIKCPKRTTHINYIERGKMPNEYKWQVQGQLLVTGYDKCYFMSYYPSLKPFIIEVLPDKEMHEQILERLEIAIEKIKTKIQKYNEW